MKKGDVFTVLEQCAKTLFWSVRIFLAFSLFSSLVFAGPTNIDVPSENPDYSSLSPSEIRDSLISGSCSVDCVRFLSAGNAAPNLDLLGEKGLVKELPLDTVRELLPEDVAKVFDDLSDDQKGVLSQTQLSYRDNLGKVGELGTLNKNAREGALSVKGFDAKNFDSGSVEMVGDRVVLLSVNFGSDGFVKFKNPLSAGVVNDPYSFVDFDGDGLSDSFEKANGLNSSAVDSDGDGLTDFDEVLKYPTDATVYNTFPQLKLKSDKEFVNWLNSNPELASGDIGAAIATLGLKSGNVFRDRDADGVSDLVEYSNGYDYAKSDSDSDGLDDGYELVRDKNPFSVNDLSNHTADSSCTDCFIELKAKKGSALVIDLRKNDSISLDLKNVNVTIKGNGYVSSISFFGNDSSIILLKKTASGYEKTGTVTTAFFNGREYDEKAVGGGELKFSTDFGFQLIDFTNSGSYSRSYSSSWCLGSYCPEFLNPSMSWSVKFSDPAKFSLSSEFVSENSYVGGVLSLVGPVVHSRPLFEVDPSLAVPILSGDTLAEYNSLTGTVSVAHTSGQRYSREHQDFSATFKNYSTGSYFELLFYNVTTEDFPVLSLPEGSSTILSTPEGVVNGSVRGGYTARFTDEQVLYDGKIHTVSWLKGSPVLNFLTDDTLQFSNGTTLLTTGKVTFDSFSDGGDGRLLNVLKSYTSRFADCRAFDTLLPGGSALSILPLLFFLPIVFGRKGQVTLFLIAGVFIIIVGALVSYAVITSYPPLPTMFAGKEQALYSSCHQNALECAYALKGMNSGKLQGITGANVTAESYLDRASAQCYKNTTQFTVADRRGKASIVESERVTSILSPNIKVSTPEGDGYLQASTEELTIKYEKISIAGKNSLKNKKVLLEPLEELEGRTTAYQTNTGTTLRIEESASMLRSSQYEYYVEG